MGYSISVNCKSQQAQTRMLKFLERHFRHWGVLMGGPSDADRYISAPQAHGKHQVGFDYGAWGANTTEREYYYALLRWVAIQVGQRRKSVRQAEALKALLVLGGPARDDPGQGRHRRALSDPDLGAPHPSPPSEEGRAATVQGG